MTKKDTTIAKLERSWTALRSIIESVPESELTAGGVVEDWSIKDIMGHVAFWDARAAATLRASAAGRPSDIPKGDGPNWVDDWNNREYLARKDKSYTDVRGEWITSHEEARNALAEIPEPALDTKFGKFKVISLFAGDTYTHYDEHAAQVKAWLREMETTEK
ncbi:MAG: maleylpyruvate isomerase N-terminal domain-containing protein [Chloroflexota bacterium]